jgi:hypothetical protein
MPGPNDREEGLEDDEDLTLGEEGEGEDAGSIDNEGGDETEAGQEPEAIQGEERLGRRERRIQALRQEARESNERAARFERELAEERARRQPQQQGESPQEESARLNLMTTEERLEYKLNKAIQANTLQMNITRYQAADMADRAAYQSKAAVDSKYKKYEAEVEQVLADSRRAGRDFDRETVLRYVLGGKVLNNNKEPQRQRGQENIRRQTARADSGRGDVSGTRQRTGSGNTLADLEKRLSGVNI